MKDIVIPTLEADDIEVKVKQIGEKGTVVLLYKTARTDMRILDEVYGVNNWQVGYEMIGDMLFCTISVWDEEKQQWISKQSNGIPSRADDEGNEVKGQASDAMKRSGFLFSIGRELYTAPFTFIPSSKLPTKKDPKNDKRWVLEDPFVKLDVTDIHYDEKRKIDRLVIANAKTGDILYTFGMNVPTSKRKQEEKKQETPKATNKQEVPKTESVKEEAPKAEQTQSALQTKVDAVVETSKTLPNPDMKPHEKVFYSFLERHKIDKQMFAEWRAMAVRGGKKITQKKFTELTPDEWILLMATMENLCEEGFFNQGEQ